MAAAASLSIAADTGERVVSGDGIVAASVGGVAARIEIDPGAAAFPTFNPAFAERAGLQGVPMSRRFVIGKVSLTGRDATAEIVLADARLKRRIAWYERPCTSTADGTLGPGALPEKRVRFALRAPEGDEHVVALPMESSQFGASYGRVEVGGATVLLRFSPSTPRSLATAGAAEVLARSNGARLSGPVSDEEIAFGVKRPVRTLRLAQPLAIGPLTLRSVQARLYDFGSTASVPDADADQDEIVVTAATGRRKARLAIVVGADALRHCSAILFDKAAGRIELSCS